MRDEGRGASTELGPSIRLAFDYVRQVFKETAQLMTRLDDLMGAEWQSCYGNTITKDLSRDLQRPGDWLARGCFGLYEREGKPGVRKGMTVVYVGRGIEQPILIGGRLDYVLADGTGAPVASDHWDLRNAWFEAGPEDKTVDGTVYRVELGEAALREHVEAARVFAIPLVSVGSEDDIRIEVYDRLIDL